MTVRIELPPGDPGSPPHRHSGPVFGYMLEGEEMLVYVDDEELDRRRNRRVGKAS
jgi:hypothetical protein